MFTLKIETGNDAFAEGNRNRELARILHKLAERVSEDPFSIGHVRDLNGTTVGEWRLTDD